ncbi:MAG: 50S ribosomal protein L9 [Gammaproteobacteria bacterium]|jgi:large subunit ribosomal protein L9|nr:50S ribosomal protein L9 [Gammaproteobacteria bacterium]
MKVILLDKVENLGGLGDLVTVKPGYARNFLIPTRKAAQATPANMKSFEERRAEFERQIAEALGAAQARAERLSEATVTIACRTGEQGKLFGSVGTADVAEAITASTGIEVKRSEVRMPEGQLRQIGSYPMELHLHPEVNVEITVEIVPEE